MSCIPGTPQTLSADERLWGMLCHLAAFAGFFVPWIGFILGPLIVWLIKKDQYPFVNDQGKESLNFQISILIYSAIAAALIVVVIGVALLLALTVMEIVLIILASVAANEGRRYRYPLTIRFVK
ncbi:MAG: DUF4870 domain-containing protein [Armatimonadota bacterium]